MNLPFTLKDKTFVRLTCFFGILYLWSSLYVSTDVFRGAVASGQPSAFTYAIIAAPFAFFVFSKEQINSGESFLRTERMMLIASASVGTGLAIASVIEPNYIVIRIAATIVFSVFHAIGALSYIYRMKKYDLKLCFASYALSAGSGSLLSIVLKDLFFVPAASILFLTLPTLAIFIIFSLDHESDNSHETHPFISSETYDLHLTTNIPLLAIPLAISGFISGLNSSLPLPEGSLESVLPAVSTVAFLSLLGILFRMGTINLSSLIYKAGFPIIAFSLVATCLFFILENPFGILFSVPYRVGESILFMALWCAAIFSHKRIPLSAVALIFLSSHALKSIGLCIGWCIEDAFSQDIHLLANFIIQMAATYTAFMFGIKTFDRQIDKSLIFHIRTRNNKSNETVKNRVRITSETYGLTQREEQILELLTKGNTKKEISEICVISENTVKTHITRIYGKLGIHSRRELFEIVDAALDCNNKNRE